ncbi:hypothetical protein, partial [Marimonas arenosa]
IITYGTMAGKSAVRDTGRVLDLPLSDTDRIAKKVHAKLNKMLDLDENEVKKKFNNDQIGDVMDLIKIYKDNT